MRQLTTALLMYTQDYDERFPGHRCALNTAMTTRWGYWYQLIAPYTKNEQIFNCPSAAGDGLSYGYNGAGTYPDNALGWRYASSAGPAPSQWAPQMSSIKYPAQMIMIADQDHSTGDLQARDFRTVEARHNEGCNIGHVDGHAKWYRGDQIKSGLDDWWRPGDHPELEHIYARWVRNPDSASGR